MSLGINRQFRVSLVIATLIVGNEAFAARADPFHRPPQSPRGPGDDGLLGIVLTLVAEAAADVGRNQPNRGLRQVKLLADDAPDVMRYLRGAIERKLAVRAAVGQNGARLDCRADQAVVDEVETHHMCGGAKGFAHGDFVAAREAEADVAGRGLVKLRRIVAHRGFRIGHRWQRLIINLHEIGSVTRLRQCLGNDGGHRLADVADCPARQRPTRRLRHRLAVGRFDGPKRHHGAEVVGRHIRAGEHGDDTRLTSRWCAIDLADASMRMRRANHHAVQLSGQRDVGDETA